MPLYNPYLIPLPYLRQHRGLADFETRDDEFLLSIIADASGDFISGLGRIPHPYTQTRAYDYRDSVVLNTLEDLLAVTTLTNGDGETIAGSDYVLEGANEYPKWRVRLKSGNSAYFTYGDSWEQAISIAGVWGYVPHYPTCWKAITMLSAALNDSATSFNVTTSQVIETGCYLLIDSEQMLVTEANGTAVIVERGVMGTTAASHLISASVKVFRQLPDIAGAVRELAAYYYKSIDRVGGRVKVFEGGMVTVEDLDPRVQKTIHRHQRVTIMGV
jgi:hypothetical protein